ncbi:MAG: choice-of-anchor Q domain-containing protein, partial [Flavobacterium sp.]
MKKTLFFIILFVFSLGYSQTLLQGFESAGSLGGTFGGFPAPVIETGTGSNTSQVLKIVTNPAGEPWQGINLNLSPSVNLTVNKTLTIDVLAFEPMTFLVKVTTGGPTAAAPVTHNGDGTWQTLSFTFNTALDGQSANPSGTYSGFVIHPYWEVGRTQFFTPTVVPKPARTFYVDNISDPTVVLPPITGNVYINDNSLAGDIWCSAVGQDIGTATGSTSLPYKSITDLFTDRTIAPGATIHVDSGTYSGRIVFSDTEDGTAGNVITIKGAGTGLTSLTSSLSGGSLISMGGADFMTFQDMTITGGNEENAILVAGISTNCTFNNLNITGNNKGIRVEGGSNFATISNNKINGDNVGATDYGIFITNGASNGHSIFNNMVSNFAHTFRSDNTGTINCNLYHNSFFANQYGSVAYLTGWNVKNNIFYTSSNDGNHVAFWYGDSTPPTTLDNNLYYHPNAARAVTRFGPNLTYASLADFVAATPYEDNGVEGNPLYVNAAAGDLHIQPGSLAIGAGVDVGITVDIDGDARPLSGTFDIGADEFDASAFVPAPTITAFTVPAQLTGAVFELTAPTSNSSGAFSYTSSNSAVATVSGSTVTVIGTGSTVITATQAAVPGEFSEGSITATLAVTLGAAPTQPARLASDVISVFAGAYDDVPGTNFNPNWGQASNHPNNFSTPSFDGDEALRYQNSGAYQGTRLGSNINVTDINKLHVNIYSPTITSLRLFLIKTDGGGVERSVTLPITPNVWNTFNIDVNATTFPGLDLSIIREIKYDNFGTNQVLIIDNFYFWREAGASPSPTITGFSVPSQALGADPFELTAPTSNSSGAFSYTSSNPAVATVSGSTVTVVGIGTSIITATQEAVPGEFSEGSTTATLTVTPPAAPTPPARNAFDVISFYSNAYTPSSSPTWGGSTNSQISISGDPTRLFTGFTNGQIAFAGTNVSQMTHVHVDVFSVNLTPMWFFLGSPGGSKRLTINTPVNGWTSLDIPLSDFTSSPTGGAIDLNNINLFRFENPVGATAPSRTIYIANIYFYRPQTDAPPTLGAFTVPTKVLGDAPFTLTPPTSNSSGAWSYTASPAGIASIDGDVVTIIGGGTATITANQAAVPGEFGPGLATASFVVTFPEPGPSPIPPVRDADRVISLYTGDESIYATVPNYNLGQAFWSTGGGRVLTEVPNGDNTALRIDGLGFMGLIDIGEVGPPAIAGERRLNLVGTGMSHLNIDIYLDAPRPNLFLVLLAPNDRLFNTGPLAAGWNTLRVPLTAYPGPLNDVYGLKIEQNYATPFRLFVDNIYFSNDLFTFYADADGDGFGDINAPILAETAPEGYVTNNTDCDDNDPTVWQTGDFYIDFDEDGYSFDGILYTICYGETVDSFYNPTSLGVDCNDFDPTVWRNADFYADVDGDGYSPTPSTIVQTVCYGEVLPIIPGLSPAIYSEVDCNDNDATIFPGAPVICYDGIQQDCNLDETDGCPQITTQLLPNDCNSTLTSMTQTVRAAFATVPAGVSVNAYRFLVTNT